MEMTTWHGCYNGSWKGTMVDDAFAHPAKFAPGLIERILLHGLERGYWRKGDLVGDPFGGVAGGGIIAGQLGMNWIGVELERDFCILGNQNLLLHYRKAWCCCGDDGKARMHSMQEIVSQKLGRSQPDAKTENRSVLWQGMQEHVPLEGQEVDGGAAQETAWEKALEPRNSMVKCHEEEVADAGFQRETGTGSQRELERGREHKARRVRGDSSKRSPETETQAHHGTSSGAKTEVASRMRSPQGREQTQQRPIESGASHDFKPHEATSSARYCPLCGKEKVDIRLLQGDSRRFSEIVAAQSVVTSPPYAEGLGHLPSPNSERLGREKNIAHPQYGQSPGQIGKLPSGAVESVITSPPFGECRTDGCGIAIDGETTTNRLGRSSLAGAVMSPPYAETAVEKSSASIDMKKNYETYKASGGGSSFAAYCATQAKHSQGYGATAGQIAALKSGDVDAVVASPPYAASNMRPTGLGSGKATRGQGDSAGRNKGDYHHPESPGQIGELPEGAPDAVVTSPPWEAGAVGGCPASKLKNPPTSGRGHAASPEARQRQAVRDEQRVYGESNGQVGNESGETYWHAMAMVYRECFKALRPGGVMAVVIKNYVKDKAVVPLCDQTMALLQATGFEPLERVRAMLTKTVTRNGLFGEEKKTIERKSFFRRLAEKKGSPRIDWEEVLFVRRPA